VPGWVMSEPLDVDRLAARFHDRTASVAVIGLGYVGLPLALTMAEKGFLTFGFDIDPVKVEQLNTGRSYIAHISARRVELSRESGRFLAVSDFSRLGKADAVIICIPTPLTRQREPDLSFVESTAETVTNHFRRGQLIVLESTTYPGTTRGIMKPILERSGLRSEQDFFLAYSPEREDPGNCDFGASQIPRVVGGDGAAALRLACALYDQIAPRTVPVSSLEVAEAVKLTENIFRSVNIALVNELKIVFEAMGVDIWEVIDGAKSKPFGYMPFYPGPGLGGHCIPIDPFYLTWKAREFGVTTRFIELAGEVNIAMPGRVVDKLSEALNERAARALNGARILILGIAYKKNVDDLRESPAFKIMTLLEARGAVVSFHDPMVAEIPSPRQYPELTGRHGVPLNPETVAGFDATVICADHDKVDYALVVHNCPLVVDTRNVCARLGLSMERVVKA
jgi:UDP-N-acetyl-D-glucosamine dehydrogenase